MPEVPKIVTERLKAGVAAGPHPDPDVLAGFSEQSLPARERESVLSHLTACAECREIIAVSLPVSEIVPEQEHEAVLVAAARPPREARKWFTWPNLSWAGLAGGVVFAVAVLSMRHSTVHPTAMVASRTYSTALESDAEKTASKSNSAVAQDKLSKEEARSAHLDSGTATTKLSARQKVAAPAPLQSELGSSEVAANEPNSSAKRDDSIPAKRELGKSRSEVGNVVGGSMLRSLPPAAMSAGVASKTTPAASAPATPARAQTETVEVNGAAAGSLAAASPSATLPKAQDEKVEAGRTVAIVADESKDADSRNYLIESNETVTKAKAPTQLASQPTEAQKSTNMKALSRAGFAGGKASAAPQWSVVGGALLRSMDAGKTWQTSLRSDPPLSCFAVNGAQVWAGGQGGIVYLSQDAGTSWTQLHPTSAGAALTADVTNIDLSGLSVILSAGNEIWTSIDTGKTWTKK